MQRVKRDLKNDNKQNEKKTTIEKTTQEENEIISEQEVTEIVCYCTNTEIPYFFEQTFRIVKMKM